MNRRPFKHSNHPAVAFRRKFTAAAEQFRCCFNVQRNGPFQHTKRLRRPAWERRAIRINSTHINRLSERRHRHQQRAAQSATSRGRRAAAAAAAADATALNFYATLMTYKCHRASTTTSRQFRPTKLRVVSTSARQRTPTLPDNDAITRRPTGALPVVTCVVRVIGRMDRPPRPPGLGDDRRSPGTVSEPRMTTVGRAGEEQRRAAFHHKVPSIARDTHPSVWRCRALLFANGGGSHWKV